jgi:hypothetical protein
MAGNAVIGALRVNLGIDTAQFTEGLGKAQSSLARFGKTVAVAAAAAGAAIAGALAAGIKHALNEADELSKMAAKIGIPVEELSKLKYAADLSGVSLQGLQTSVGRLARNMSDAADGTGEGKKAFDKLGISVVGADGKLKSASQVMGEIGDKFVTLPNGAQKTALAMILMGRSGADMIPLLNGGSAALNAMLVEAKSLGLEISQKTASAAEQFNDNLSRMGYAISGLTLGLTAALAPALATITDALVEVVKGLLGLLQYLPVLAEYAAVAGGTLAVMFSPAIIAAVEAFAEAVLVGAVGAVRALTAAISANPLGALAVAVVGAVTAIYYFRDEIQKVIGIDVVGIVKDGANLIINSFRAAFADIQFVWAQLPNIIGGAVVGAVNAVINGVNVMVKAAKSALNQVIELTNNIPGVNIGTTDASQGLVDPLKNTYADELSKAVGDRNARIAEIMSSDPIGEIGKAFSASTPAVLNMNTALGGTADALDDIGGGGKKGGGSKVKKVKDQFDRVGESIERAKESLGQGFSGVLEGLINKSLSWKDALVQAGQALLKYLNQMNVAKGGKGLFGGGFLQGLLGGLVGFASGGTILPGGSGGIDSQLVAFRKSPNEQVDITKPGQRRAGSGRSVSISQSFSFSGASTSEELRAYARQMGAAAVDQVKGNLSGWQVQLNRDGVLS